jgi:hypothetical protein
VTSVSKHLASLAQGASDLLKEVKECMTNGGGSIPDCAVVCRVQDVVRSMLNGRKCVPSEGDLMNRNTPSTCARD